MGARGTARVRTLTHQSSVTGPLGLGTGDGGGAGTADADSSRPTTSRDSVAPPLEPPIKRPAGTVLPRRRYRGGSVASDADPPSRVSIDPPHPPRPLLPWRSPEGSAALRVRVRKIVGEAAGVELRELDLELASRRSLGEAGGEPASAERPRARMREAWRFSSST